MTGFPVIDADLCTRCGLCEVACLGRLVDSAASTINPDGCILCGHCIAVCPVGAITVRTAESTDAQQGTSSVQNIFLQPEKLSGKSADPAAFANLVRSRRTCRRYQNRPVDSTLLDQLIDLARWTPTGTNSRSVHLTVLATPERVASFSNSAMTFFVKAARLLINPVVLPLLYPFITRKKALRVKGFAERYFDRFRSGEDVLAHGAAALVIFHAPRSASTPQADCVICATTMTLHAETLGLGTCFNGFAVYALSLSRKLRREYGIPANHRVHETLLVGHPAVRWHNLPPREPLPVTLLE